MTVDYASCSLRPYRNLASSSRPRCHLHHVPVPIHKLRLFDLCCDDTSLHSYGLLLRLRLFTRSLYRQSAVASSAIHTSIQYLERRRQQIHSDIADAFFALNDNHDNQLVPLQYSSLRRPAFHLAHPLLLDTSFLIARGLA